MLGHDESLAAALPTGNRLERPLGRGGMATVHLALDLKHHRKVAVKVLESDYGSAVGATRFLREIEIAAALNHPNILAVHDSGEAAGVLYYVTPYVEGKSLRDRLGRERRPPLDGTLAITRGGAGAPGDAPQNRAGPCDIQPGKNLISFRHP